MTKLKRWAKFTWGVPLVWMPLACGSGNEPAMSATGGSSSSPSAGSGGSAGSPAGGAGGAAAGSSGSATVGGSGGMAGAGDGVCRPKSVKPTDNPKTVTLVKQEVAAGAGATRLTSVRSYKDAIVYATNAGVYRLSKMGGTPETISATAGVERLYLVGDTLYWMSGMALMSVAATATNAMPAKVIDTTLDIGSDYLFAIDATSAYSWKRSEKAIVALSLATGMPTPLLSGKSSQNWLLDGNFVYYAGDYDTFMRVAKTGGMPEQLHQGQNILWAPAVDGTQLYYGGSDQIVRIDPPNETRLMETSVGFIQRIVPQGDLLLWEGWMGSVGFLSKDGSRCGIVVDSTFGFADWDHDDANFYVALKSVIYKIPF